MVNRAELAAINLKLKLGQHAFQSDSACSLRLIHKYTLSRHTMQRHPHKEVIYSIMSALQTHTPLGLTTHIGKIIVHKNSTGNDQAAHLAKTVADGQPPHAIYFICAQAHLGQ
jgi:hypothetical protein